MQWLAKSERTIDNIFQFDECNAENYLPAYYLSYRISLNLSFADIWPCAFYHSITITYLNRERNAPRESFFAHFLDHDIISAYIQRRDNQKKEKERSRGVTPAVHVYVKGTCLLARRLGRVSCSNGVRWSGVLVHFIIQISMELIANTIIRSRSRTTILKLYSRCNIYIYRVHTFPKLFNFN